MHYYYSYGWLWDRCCQILLIMIMMLTFSIMNEKLMILLLKRWCYSYKLLWFQYTCSVDKTKNINCFDDEIFGRGFKFNCLIWRKYEDFIEYFPKMFFFFYKKNYFNILKIVFLRKFKKNSTFIVKFWKHIF